MTCARAVESGVIEENKKLALGGEVTLRNQVSMPLGGRVQCIDFCIHHIVAALNAGGIRTVASCCGHEEMPGRIGLEDGRTLAIANNRDAQGGQAATMCGFTDLALVERLRGDPTLLADLDRLGRRESGWPW